MRLHRRMSQRMRVTVLSAVFCLSFSFSENMKIKVYRTVIFPALFYAHGTLSHILKKEVFHNRAFKKDVSN